MRIVGWLVLVLVGFPVSGLLTWLLVSFAVGFWNGIALGVTGADPGLGSDWWRFAALGVWFVLARWYYLRGHVTPRGT